MKPVKLVLMATAILCLTFVVTAQGPQNGQPQQGQPQADPDRIEAAHSELLNAKDKAAEASKLTEAVAPALPGAAASTAPIPRKNFIDEHIFGRISATTFRTHPSRVMRSFCEGRMWMPSALRRPR